MNAAELNACIQQIDRDIVRAERRMNRANKYGYEVNVSVRRRQEYQETAALHAKNVTLMMRHREMLQETLRDMIRAEVGEDYPGGDD